jgi:hypothetical protein
LEFKAISILTDPRLTIYRLISFISAISIYDDYLTDEKYSDNLQEFFDLLNAKVEQTFKIIPKFPHEIKALKYVVRWYINNCIKPSFLYQQQPLPENLD